MCIKDICYNMYYCIYETFHSLNGNNHNISVQRKILFVDEENGFIYYNKLPSSYDYDCASGSAAGSVSDFRSGSMDF